MIHRWRDAAQTPARALRRGRASGLPRLGRRAIKQDAGRRWAIKHPQGAAGSLQIRRGGGAQRGQIDRLEAHRQVALSPDRGDMQAAVSARESHTPSIARLLRWPAPSDVPAFSRHHHCQPEKWSRRSKPEGAGSAGRRVETQRRPDFDAEKKLAGVTPITGAPWSEPMVQELPERHQDARAKSALPHAWLMTAAKEASIRAGRRLRWEQPAHGRGNAKHGKKLPDTHSPST